MPEHYIICRCICITNSMLEKKAADETNEKKNERTEKKSYYTQSVSSKSTRVPGDTGQELKRPNRYTNYIRHSSSTSSSSSRTPATVTVLGFLDFSFVSVCTAGPNLSARPFAYSYRRRRQRMDLASIDVTCV